jgi:hypothetical protein
MGLFGSSRKKTRGPFQAPVEQQRRRNPTAMFGDRRSESARQRNAHYFRPGDPSAWQKNANEHPYGQPGFGFYSGENLAAGRPQQPGPRESMSVDDGFRNTPPGLFSDPFERDLPCSPYWGYPGPSFGRREAGHATEPPWLDPDDWNGLGARDSLYAGPEEPSLYPRDGGLGNYIPNTIISPIGRSIPTVSRRFPPRSAPLNMSRYPDQPIFDQFRPFRDSPVPNPYTAPPFNRNVSSDRHPPWSPFADRTMDPFQRMRTSNVPTHPPGSYERLRPAHLERGNSRAGSRGGTRSSSLYMGEIR